jgi:hypothetical protein
LLVKQAMRQRNDKLMTTTAHRSPGDKILIQLASELQVAKRLVSGSSQSEGGNVPAIKLHER